MAFFFVSKEERGKGETRRLIRCVLKLNDTKSDVAAYFFLDKG